MTGGAGFIGSHLVARLIREGHTVRVLDDFSSGRRQNLVPSKEIDLLEGDIGSAQCVRSATSGVDAVFHLAALPSVARSWRDPVRTLSVNAHGTATVIEAAIAAGAEAFIYSSSSSVYGDQSSAEKSEQLHPQPISPYGYSKLLGEKIVLAHSRAGDIRVVALRYFNVFGPRQDPDSEYAAVIPRFIRHTLAGTTATVYGDGYQTRDFTYVDNVVDANLLALTHDSVSGIAINVASGEARTIRDLITQLSELNGHRLTALYSEPRPGDIRHSKAKLDVAEQLLGYHPRTSFEQGLKETYEAYATR